MPQSTKKNWLTLKNWYLDRLCPKSSPDAVSINESPFDLL